MVLATSTKFEADALQASILFVVKLYTNKTFPEPSRNHLVGEMDTYVSITTSHAQECDIHTYHMFSVCT